MRPSTTFTIYYYLATAAASGWVGTSSAFLQTQTPGAVGSIRRIQQGEQHVVSNSPRYVVSMDRQLSDQNVEDKSSRNGSDNSSDDQLQSLWVFVHTLQRERREKSPKSSLQQQRSPAHKEATTTTKKRKFHSAKSLAIFLNKNRFVPADDALLSGHHNVEPFSRAVVQAIRLASELGDYKLILHLVEASIEYANNHAIIMPRVFGEAIDGISKTSANSAKIKQLWNLGVSASSSQSQSTQTFLTEPLGTFELNVMIKAIAARGKINAALDLYRTHTTSQQTEEAPRITPDPYTLSSIFTALQDSITDDQATKQQQQQQTASSSSMSQCWQWNEAMRLLTSYLEHEDWPPLNNHVFSSLLKLNDRVSQVYTSAHNGPKMALYLLNLMHQLNISPDVVTCTLIISNLGYQWKTAINLLYAMKTTPPDASSSSSSSSIWKLPRPNVYTYSAVITICAHCHQYNAAMELLEEMKKDNSMDNPNTWVYNAALLATTRSDSLAVLTAESPSASSLSATATKSSSAETSHHQQHPATKRQHRSAPKQRRSRDRLLMAMKLLREMQSDDDDDGGNNNRQNCRPDTVTYNTVLATLDGIASPKDDDTLVKAIGLDQQFASYFDAIASRHTEDGEKASDYLYFEEFAVHSLLDEMVVSNIPRDSITYRNALLAIRFSEDIRKSVWKILDRALEDQQTQQQPKQQQRATASAAAKATTSSDTVQQSSTSTTTTRGRRLDGKAADGITFVFDTAMTVLSSHGDVEGVLLALDRMMKEQKQQQPQTPTPPPISQMLEAAQIHFVQALGRAPGSARTTSTSAMIPIFLNATMGDRIARLAITTQYPTIDTRLLLNHSGNNEALFSAAISACLVANNIDDARKVLALMREQGLQPSDLSLQEIARTYARLAVIAADQESKNESSAAESKSIDGEIVVETETAKNATMSLATTRAKNAYTIATKTLSDPPASLLSTVARTCASLGMWTEASTLLKQIHRRIPLESNEMSNIGSVGAAQTVLPGLHRALLRASSIQGNVTAALWFVGDIQELSSRLTRSTKRQNEEEELLLSSSGEKAPYEQDQASLLSQDDNSIDMLGMAAEDWKLLMIAASKSGHWRVCLTTLQFMRPFLEETHPSSLGITVEERSRRYGHLAPALTVALKCLEVRSQYGWAVRAIDDWIEWCGRRPPKEAVLAAIRVMSKRGRGREVNSLLERCTGDDGAALLSYGNNDGNYELALYVGAITALHNEGLYDDADDAFLAAVRRKFLPFDLQTDEVDGNKRIVLDLHGMNVPVAHSAVRVALQHEVELASWMANPSTKPSESGSIETIWDNDMVIVTGRGRNSALRMRPVLRPEVQRMLVEEFFPPLSTASIPGNMGAVRVPADDIQKWLSHQRQQKGSRMLAVASVIRNISSIDRLRQSLALKINTEENENPSEEKGN